MPVKKIVVLTILLLLLPPALTLSAQGGSAHLPLEHEGAARSYYRYIPASYDGQTPVPLLVGLHARGSSGRALAILSGLEAAAEQQGFIAMFPDALQGGWAEDASEAGMPDDPGFIAALVEQVSADYAIDPARVVLTGFGNGGLMAYRLLCETPEAFAGVAVVGPLLWGYHRAGCPPVESANPASLLVMYGNADLFYTGETHTYTPLGSTDTYEILGAADTLDFWAAQHGCADAPDESGAPGEPADHIRLYAECAGGSRVALYEVAGGKQLWYRTGDYTLNPFGIDATTIVTSFLLGEDDTWLATAPIQPADPARSYVAYVPAGYDPAAPTPLVIVLHGRWGSGAGTAEYTHMNEVAEANGFIALYPDGLLNDRPATFYDTGWNYYYGNPFIQDMPGPDDAAFLAALIDDLALDLNIDPARVYVAGMSNGAFMVNHLACHDPARYAGFASVAGSGYLGMAESCEHDVPVPMIIIHGTADDNILWNGNTAMLGGQERYVTYPIAEVFTFWAAHNACDLSDSITADIPRQDEASPTRVRMLAPVNCPPGAEVVLYGVINGGHNWPGVAGYGPGAGQVNMDLNASEVIWEFFAAHARGAEMED